MADLLGVDPLSAGVRFRKSGGIYGNFFHDVSSRTRQLMTERNMENKRKIQYEGNLKPDEPTTKKGKPKTTLSRIRDLAELSPYDTGTQSEAEMIESVAIANARLSEIATRLQRIWRTYALIKIRRLFWWRQLSAISIQRCVRGHFGRLYSSLLRRLLPKAAKLVQICFRHYLAMRVIYSWRELVFRIRRALPNIKRFVNNCFKSWIRRRHTFAIRMQSMVRGYLTRLQYLRKLGQIIFLQNIYPNAALLIQKTFRGFLGRRKFVAFVQSLLEQRILRPKCVQIQSLYRGYLARLVAKMKRHEMRCLRLLQRFFRDRLFHKRLGSLIALRRMTRAAVTIQRVFRGTFDRKIATAMRNDYYFKTVYVPSVIRVQAAVRGRIARNAYRVLLDVGKYATAIQRQYRKYCYRREALKRLRAIYETKLIQSTILLQKTVRAFLAKLKFRQIMLASVGNRLRAAKIIARTWIGYRLRSKYEALRDKHRLRLFASKLIGIQNSRSETEDDIAEIRNDIAYLQKAMAATQSRIKDLDAFIVQTENRLPKIVKQLENLTDYDVEYSWDEALALEHKSLTQRSAHAREELRMLRNALILKRKEQMKLYLELGK